jgi:hypothetical protein
MAMVQIYCALREMHVLEYNLYLCVFLNTQHTESLTHNEINRLLKIVYSVLKIIAK